MTPAAEDRLTLEEFREHAQENKDAHDDLRDGLNAMRKFLHGNGEVGYAERLRNVERIVGKGVWFFWASVVYILGQIGLSVWSTVQSLPLPS